jgi:transposase
MRAYSQDLRDRVIEARSSGETAAEVCKRYKVSRRFVERCWRRYVDYGEARAYQIGGGRISKLSGYADTFRKLISSNSDISIDELVIYCAMKLGIKISRNALWWQMDKMGLSFKKNAARQRARQTRRTSKT